MKGITQDSIHIESCTRFCNEVESLAKKMSYMDSVLALADRRNIEPEMAATYLSPDIKEKIRIEAENLNLMPRTASLPF